MAVVYVRMYFKCKICFTVYTGEIQIDDTYLLNYLENLILPLLFLPGLYLVLPNSYPPGVFFYPALALMIYSHTITIYMYASKEQIKSKMRLFDL